MTIQIIIDGYSLQHQYPYHHKHHQNYHLEKAIMAKRTQTYELARAKHPERWSGSIRDWSLPYYLCLNPMSEGEVRDFINIKNDGLKEQSLKLV